MLNPKDYSKIITSRHRLFDLHLHEAWEYRNLVRLFVRRDITTAYKQTVFGPLWFFINPILSTLVFTLIFGNLAQLPLTDAADGAIIPSFLFYMIGNICWAYFSATLRGTSNTFRANAGLMSKVYYPRIVSSIATACSNLVTASLQLALFFAVYLGCSVAGLGNMQITWKLLLIPVAILELTILSIGCGIIISSFTTKYRDLGMLVGLFLRFWQYATPLLYGLELVQTRIPNLLAFYMLNPLTPMITSIRYGAFGYGFFNFRYYLISWLISIIVFFAGLILFSRVERSFVDTI